jgi:hypothetical protein
VISKKLSEHITLINDAQNKQPAEWNEELASNSKPTFLTVFENTKWSRQMRGRLYFYANSPDHFDSGWCIENELNRINRMFFVVPYSAYWQIKTGEKPAYLPDVVESLRGNLLTDKQADATIKYHELTSQKYHPSEYHEAALQIVSVFEDFFRGLYNVTEKLKSI